MTIYSGFSHWKWWFSIVMLVYQRVVITNIISILVVILLLLIMNHHPIILARRKVHPWHTPQTDGFGRSGIRFVVDLALPLNIFHRNSFASITRALFLPGWMSGILLPVAPKSDISGRMNRKTNPVWTSMNQYSPLWTYEKPMKTLWKTRGATPEWRILRHPTPKPPEASGWNPESGLLMMDLKRRSNSRHPGIMTPKSQFLTWNML